MKMAVIAAGFVAASLLWTGCGQSSRDSTNRDSSTNTTSTQPIQNVQVQSNAADEDWQEETASRFSDAKDYCLGMLLYALKHGNMFPTNLNQTLPYLSAAKAVPSGTNHFDILYHGSLDKLPNPMTNGIILIRSDPCRMAGGRWTRVYGFADGHCERHSEPDSNFAAWEEEHSLTRHEK